MPLLNDTAQGGMAVHGNELHDPDLEAAGAAAAAVAAHAATDDAHFSPPDLPDIAPTLLLDFASAKSLDPIVDFSRSSSGTYFDAAGILRTAASDEPRFDHDPVTGGCLGLLIEEPRTNLLTYSEDFTTTWVNFNSNGIVTANAGVAPDGMSTADSFLAKNGTAVNYLAQGVSVTSASTYTFSVYVKQISWQYVQLALGAGGFGTNKYANFDLDNKLTSESGVSAAISDAGNGWFRLSITATATASTTTYCGMIALVDSLSDGLTSSCTGDGASGIYVWGSQTEVGSFPTSYIKTTSGTATRNADIATVAVSDFEYNQSEGSVVCGFIIDYEIPADKYPAGIYLHDGGNNNRMNITFASEATAGNNTVAFAGKSGGALQWSGVGILTVPVSSTVSIACGYKADSIAAFVNGDTGSTDDNASIPTVTTLTIGDSNSQTLTLNGYVSRLSYYPKRLTNSQLQALTEA